MFWHDVECLHCGSQRCSRREDYSRIGELCLHSQPRWMEGRSRARKRIYFPVRGSHRHSTFNTEVSSTSFLELNLSAALYDGELVSSKDKFSVRGALRGVGHSLSRHVLRRATPRSFFSHFCCYRDRAGRVESWVVGIFFFCPPPHVVCLLISFLSLLSFRRMCTVCLTHCVSC